ncbi:MAG: pyridoxal-phosphate dependent enzyme [Dehalococcoidia bacterium]|nr:pyridoxal-phosphate dependent enzyme [Dehalococcoidia bacterium]
MSQDILSLVGHTPMVELRSCSPKPGVRLFAKLEGQNPSGSVKDRIVAYIIDRARREGRLAAGQEIVEASTGNTGIALAMIGRRLGHPVRVVVPDNAFGDVIQTLKALGAKIELAPARLGIKSAIDAAQEIARGEGAFLLNQFDTEDNPLCHYETTAVEVIEQLPDLDVFVCGLGTSGTAMGVGRRLKEHNPAIKIVAAEPRPGQYLQGLRSLEDGYMPPIFSADRLDGKIVVSSANAFRAVRELLRREGILAGLSSGAVLHAALKWCQRLENGKVVMLFADSGWKYLNSPAYALDEQIDAEDDGLDEVLWW